MAFKISLNGSNYVSEAREKAFETALADSQTVTVGQRTTGPAEDTPGNDGTQHQNGNGHQDQVVRASSDPTVPEAERSTSAPLPPQIALQDAGRVLEGLERGLSKSYDHQSETLRVHQQYLSNQASYADIFAALMQEQGTLFTSDNTAGNRAEVLLQVLQSLNRSVEHFHTHQSETLGVHERFLQQQADYAQAFIELLQSHYGAALNGNGNGHHGGNGHNGNGHSRKTSPDGNGHQGQAVGATTQGQTGQRTDVALGASVQGSVGQAPEPSSYAQSGVVAAPLAQERPAPVPSEEPAPQSVLGEPVDATLAVSAAELSDALLDIVSDKTGYPAEMLELDMDMEADLGIDSIKRVEILGALQDAYPGLPDVEADILAELRTLAQVIEYMSSAVTGVPDVGLETELAPVVEADTSSRTTADAVDVETLSQDLLEIVSDKTGYPAEMLELDMDMEADLGIDSIKRVEILGALQDQHPDLPEVETDALAELRTLAQILDYMAEGVSGASPAFEEAAQPATGGSKKV